MSNLDKTIATIGASVFLPGISLATLPQPYRQAAERAQQAAISVVGLEQRLASDREMYGISESEQARLLSLGLYEAAIGIMAVDRANELKDSVTSRF